eukprot:TRINITY_DN19180_c0_g1_i1.p2 TRINITY_DN19180_c0_g1~~TRINITY_DN19180_c0_g1_i1.p2  ORF type:complete len:120 (-),score=17.01 TRINITY_DN19180_c0_g1_i1:27-386(-)
MHNEAIKGTISPSHKYSVKESLDQIDEKSEEMQSPEEDCPNDYQHDSCDIKNPCEDLNTHSKPIHSSFGKKPWTERPNDELCENSSDSMRSKKSNAKKPAPDHQRAKTSVRVVSYHEEE